MVVGMSGSSAPQLGQAFLRATQRLNQVETHLVLSGGVRRSIELELRTDPADIEKLADVVYDAADLGSSVSSGSFPTMEWWSSRARCARMRPGDHGAGHPGAHAPGGVGYDEFSHAALRTHP